MPGTPGRARGLSKPLCFPFHCPEPSPGCLDRDTSQPCLSVSRSRDSSCWLREQEQERGVTGWAEDIELVCCPCFPSLTPTNTATVEGPWGDTAAGGEPPAGPVCAQNTGVPFLNHWITWGLSQLLALLQRPHTSKRFNRAPPPPGGCPHTGTGTVSPLWTQSTAWIFENHSTGF